jgi:ribosomal protein L37AE/L43A
VGGEFLPEWAPRVAQAKIRRLYELDALGIHDEDLLDEVGYALLARCRSFITANQAVAGQATCPVCGGGIAHNRGKEEVLHCLACGWELTWGAYFATIQHRQLSGAEPVLTLFGEFVTRFPAAATPAEKMLAIDNLIHGFHWYQKFGPTRPVAVNLIEGRLGEVIAFLDRLSLGPESTPGIQEKHAEWEEKSQNARGWGSKSDPRGV